MKNGTAKAKTPKKEMAYDLRLYVAGQTPRSLHAFSNLKRICDEHLAGRYRFRSSICSKIRNWPRATRFWRSRLWCEPSPNRRGRSSAICRIPTAFSWDSISAPPAAGTDSRWFSKILICGSMLRERALNRSVRFRSSRVFAKRSWPADIAWR